MGLTFLIGSQSFQLWLKFKTIECLDAEQAESPLNKFQRTRLDHSQELNEDYVELIDDLVRESGSARITDIATNLNVSTVTVSKRIRKLVTAGLVEAEKYKTVQLTPEGKNIADKSRERHEQVQSFLLFLGVSKETAEIDAEGIEHHCSEETLNAMMKYLRDTQS